jgi:hypothetical protein
MSSSEERLSGSYGEMDELHDGAQLNIPAPTAKGRLSVLLFQGPSVYDAWFSATSNQVNLEIRHSVRIIIASLQSEEQEERSSAK